MTLAPPEKLFEEGLTNEQQFQRDMHMLGLVGLSDEEEALLIQRATQGDTEAGQALLLSVLPCVSVFVKRYRRQLWAEGRDIRRLEYLDLVQVSSLAMLERLSDALAAECPGAYLVGVAYKSIKQYCHRHESPVSTPDHYDTIPMVVSGDRPVTAAGDMTMFDLLTDESAPPPPPAQDYTPLYHALDELPNDQRETVIHHYGLFETPCETFHDLDTRWQQPGRSSSSAYHKRAVVRLHTRLAAVYTADGTGDLAHVLVSRTRTMPLMPLSSQQREQLQLAHERLRERGERVSVRTLQKEAHVGGSAARSYLGHYREQHPERTCYERLAHTYTLLQTQGQAVTVRGLAEAAHTDRTAASAYLRHLQSAPVNA